VEGGREREWRRECAIKQGSERRRERGREQRSSEGGSKLVVMSMMECATAARGLLDEKKISFFKG
jgi:hypothetical protein